MATINVKDAAGATVALEKPLIPGQAAMTASRPVVIASDQSTVPVSLASVPSHAVTNAGTFAVQATVAAAATNIAKAEDVASADADVGVPALAVRKATPANTSGTDGDYEFLQMSAGRLWTSSDVSLAGTAAAAGSGATSASTLRTVLATDSPGIIATGTAGTPSATVLTIQGVTSMTPLKVDNTFGQSAKPFTAAFTTLTRPANTTAYTAADSISDNATAGSVTALSATVSDTNDDPVTVTEVLITSTDTGLAGKRIRAYLYNSDPTASSGVVNGDNAVFSNKRAGYVGSVSGVLETGFSDGTVGRLVPSYNDTAAASTANAAAGGFIVTKPTSGARTLFIQFQAIDGFTPSANSTTIIANARGFQGRAN